MTKAEAVNTLLQSTWLDQACRTVAGELWQDLKQEFWLHILEKDPAKFECIRDPERSLMFWSAKIMWTIYLPKTNGTSDKKYKSKFVKAHEPQVDVDISLMDDGEDRAPRNGHLPSETSIARPITNYIASPDYAKDIEDKQHVETFAEFAQSQLGSMPFYERGIFALCLEGKSAREIQRYTKIDRKEVSTTLKRVIEEIKEKWKQTPHYEHFLQG